ncbi:MAG: hypothetical protein KBT10_01085 [Bacteroidales bacterium]|nr:hypothetical protein [Candidatus Sodaliphilus aphodohippi]
MVKKHLLILTAVIIAITSVSSLVYANAIKAQKTDKSTALISLRDNPEAAAEAAPAKAPQKLPPTQFLKGDGAEFFGVFLYNRSWGSKPPTGLWKINTLPTVGQTQILSDKTIGAAQCGAIGQGVYVLSTGKTWIVLDYNTLEVLETKDINEDMQAIAMTYDIATDKFYVFFQTGDSRMLFGDIDINTWKINLRNRGYLQSEQIATLAADNNGNIYGTSVSGYDYYLDEYVSDYLYKIDPATGDLTQIGETGLRIQPYLQGATVDPATNKMYWYATWTDYESYPGAHGGLYQVDLNTGKASAMNYVASTQQVTAIAFAPVVDNAAPAIPTVTYAAGETPNTIKISATAPTTTKGGEALNGKLGLKIYMDGNLVVDESDAADAGATVERIINVAPGRHSYRVLFTNASGDGIHANIWKKYVGAAQPSDVTNLTLTDNKDTDAKTDNLKLTWTAPTVDTEGAPINTESMSYKVVRTDGVVVAENLKETTFTEELNDFTKSKIGYTVYVNTDGGQSAGVTSNKVLVGVRVQIPYLADFENDKDTWSTFTYADVNGDKNTWRQLWYPTNAALGCGLTCDSPASSKTSADDWLFTPSIYVDKPGCYLLKLCAYGWHDNKYPTSLEAFIGDGPTPDDMFIEVFPTTEYNDTYYNRDTTYAYFTVEEAGIYYLGLHANWPRLGTGSLGVSRIEVVDGLDDNCPAKVTDLTVVPGENGALKANVEFTAPAVNVMGNTITSIKTVNVYRDGVLIGTTNATPGQKASFTDENVPAIGTYKYTVAAVTDAGEGIPESVSAYIGIDTPTASTWAKLVVDGDVATITWNNVEKGVNNSFLGDITYRITDNENNVVAETKGTKLADGSLSETVTINNEGDARLLNYKVVAITDAGESPAVTTNNYIIGAAVPMDYKEGFPVHVNGTSTGWYIKGEYDHVCDIITNKGNVTTSIARMDQDLDFNGGVMSLVFKDADSEVLFYTCPIDLSKATDAVEWQMFFYASKGYTITPVYALGNSHEWVELKDAETYKTGTGGFKHIGFSLAELKGKVVTLGLKLSAPYSSTTIYVDNMEVINAVETDARINQLNTTDEITEGQNYDVNVLVQNIGKTIINGSDYTISLYQDDELIATKNGFDMPDGASFAEQTFQVTATAKTPEITTLRVVVDCKNDGNIENNTVELQIPVNHNVYPPVENLYGEGNDLSAQLTWTAPNTEEPVYPVVHDGAEAYQDFSIGGISEDDCEGSFGDWKLVDEDCYDDCYAFGSASAFPNPNRGGYQAYQILRPSWWLTGSPLARTHSGQKMFACWSNDDDNSDWLISPELSGREQHLTFYSRAMDLAYDKFYVMTSTEDNDPGSFDQIYFNYCFYDWKGYDLVLPEGTKYFAIYVFGSENSAALFDDFGFEAKGIDLNGQLVGYNIYRDGIKIAGPIGSLEYLDQVDSYGTYKYQVSAVYSNNRESILRDVNVQLGPTGINDVTINAIRVNQVGKNIQITGTNGKAVGIYTVDGKLVYSGIGDATTEVDNNGVYVVRCGKQATKVVVK